MPDGETVTIDAQALLDVADNHLTAIAAQASAARAKLGANAEAAGQGTALPDDRGRYVYQQDLAQAKQNVTLLSTQITELRDRIKQAVTNYQNTDGGSANNLNGAGGGG